MVSSRAWIIINISLGLLAVLLLLNFFGIQLPTLGKAQFLLDPQEPVCMVNWQDGFTLWNDLDRCCLEARKQLSCQQQKMLLENEELDWVCQTGQGKVLKYWLNNKAYHYCTQQSIWK